MPIADIAWDARLAAMRGTQSESLLRSFPLFITWIVGVGSTEQRWRKRVEALPAFVCKIVPRPSLDDGFLSLSFPTQTGEGP